MRIAPAVLRIQQGAIQIKVDSASAEKTRLLLTELQPAEGIFEPSENFDFSHEGFKGRVYLEDLKYIYPGSRAFAIDSVSMEISPGQVVAIVGPSGAGKSTLVDLILGVISPASGSITISGATPREILEAYPGACGYVPQEVFIIDGSIAENIAIGFETDTFDYERMAEVVRIAQLENLIESFPMGLEERVGERGSKLSGGQRQRLGIARSLYTNPKLLILDEATSALDGQTEADISNAISAMRGDVTIILIAHRLSTVRKADQVVYLENGKVISTGSFEKVRNDVRNFDSQAELMGL
jgi:ABC-type multidrug transport system fused ATPase/permease subunit